MMKGRTTFVYSLRMLAKSVSTASGIPVPLSSLLLSSLDLNIWAVSYYSESYKIHTSSKLLQHQLTDKCSLRMRLRH